MKLIAPTKCLDFKVSNIYGKPIKLSDFREKAVVLSFFRDISCPFCNRRVFELSHRYKKWQEAGVEVIAVFSSTPEEIREFVSKYPRRFNIIGDPNLEIYHQYGIEQSFVGLLKAIAFKMPDIIQGFKNGGRPTKNPNGKILPADFLIDPNGVIRDAWYGDNTSGHIPMQRLEDFVSTMSKLNNFRNSMLNVA